jgi:hypothetical protein
VKTYKEVIERAGKKIYSVYMSGSYEYYNVVAFDEIAFIFEKTADEVFEDSRKAFLYIVDVECGRFPRKE